MDTPNIPFEIRVGMLRGYLYNYAIKLTADHNEADDLVQETILKAMERHKDYTEEGQLRYWLKTILRNKHIDSIRRNSRRRMRDVSEFESLLPVPPDALSALACQEIRRSVCELPTINCRVIELRIEGYSFKEIGHQLGINTGNARVRAHHGYKQLRGKL